MDKALRNQVIEAVHPSYIRSLYNVQTGYGNLTCRQLLEHLWLQYGTIMQDELEANTKSMMQPWSPPAPIKTLFTQLDECAIFVIAGGEAIAPATIVRIGYNILEANGLFDTACHKWRTEVTAPNKTLVAFKALVQKHLPALSAMAMGHLDQQRSNLRSTKPKPSKKKRVSKRATKYKTPQERRRTSCTQVANWQPDKSTRTKPEGSSQRQHRATTTRW